jgi:hypothetical protein
MNGRKGLRSKGLGLGFGFLFILTLYHIFGVDGFSTNGMFGMFGSQLPLSINNKDIDATEAAADGINNKDSDPTEAAAEGIDPGSVLAFKQSFGLFHDISNAAWEGIRKKTLATSWYANPDNPLEKIDDGAWWNEHNMKPNFDCPRLEKVGGKNHDGEKVVCNPRRLIHEGKSDCLIYSVGCAGDYAFEDGIYKMFNKSCEIHVFDPAEWTRPNDAEVKNIHYHAWGLISTYDGSKSVVWPRGRGGGFKTFPETLELLGHQNRTIDLFKIDCEGCVSSY